MANNFLKEFPSRTELLDWYNTHGSNIVHEVNGHFHTPYSFSAFRDMRQLFEMARSEHIKILGINDFYTMTGYEEFHDLSIDYKTFPLFNIEFMGLLKDEQKNDIRVNDPNNPGRIYFSGKGIDYPVTLEGPGLKKLDMVREESSNQTKEMFRLALEYLASIDPELILEYEVALKQYTRGMMRERHIAKIIRELIYGKYKDDESKNEILQKLYEGKEPQAKCGNLAAVEDEIRSRLLKTGGIAYVKEDSKAFLELDEISRIITEAGGIPTYPVLLDDKNGDYTDYERNSENLYNELSARDIYSLELIPGRNDFEHLKEFVLYFHDRGFMITFGTEHNTPELIPLKVSTRGGKHLDEELKRINFEGACIIAAHQYLRAKEEDGYVDKNGKPRLNQKEEFIELGNAVIEYFLQS